MLIRSARTCWDAACEHGPAKTRVEEGSENLGATILRVVLEEVREGVTYITVGRQSAGLLRLRFFLVTAVPSAVCYS